MIGGDGFFGAREAGEVERRERAVDHVHFAERRRGVDDVDAGRAARAEPRVELLGHPVGERADLVDMGDHRRAPADRKPALLRRHEAAAAEQQQLAPVRAVRLQDALGRRRARAC